MSDGYRVGDPHPSSRGGARQFNELADTEVADLVAAVIHAFAVELRRRGIAGSERVAEWELAEQIRETIVRQHRAAHDRTVGNG